jgi:hypothetical protein
VSVTPDGSLALVRRDGSDAIGIVDLKSGTRSEVKLDGPVTDLDVSADGKRALAVVRSKATVSVLRLPAVATDPTALSSVKIEGETIGSVVISRGGDSALLYSNAAMQERVTALRINGDRPQDLSFRTIKLYSPVLAVFPSPNAEHAIVVHQAPAFSLLPVANTLPAKIVEANGKIEQIAFSDLGDRAIISERGPNDKGSADHSCYLASFPELSVEKFALASPPIAAGIIGAAGRAYVSQAHPDGRITFLNLKSGAAQTITGFEIGARIQDGSGR